MPYVGKSMDRKRNARISRTLVDLDAWNRANPVGTLVRYWKGIRQGEPSGTGATTCEAYDAYGTSVVFIEGCSGFVALTHVETIGKTGGHEG